NLAAWDKDHNNLIDLQEYKAYFQDRWENRKVDRGQAGTPGPSPESGVTAPGQGQPVPQAPARKPVEVRKPLVYHADNLPRELPSWFAELDTNHDAQIGLYEWKLSGRPLAEFQRMDRNNDGFLTVEEVLAYQAQETRTNSDRREAASRPLRSSRTPRG